MPITLEKEITHKKSTLRYTLKARKSRVRMAKKVAQAHSKLKVNKTKQNPRNRSSYFQAVALSKTFLDHSSICIYSR